MSSTKAPKRILVVEDEEAIREIVVDAIEAIGHEAIERAEGLPAIQAVARERPDLVILDVGLPDVDGFSVCSRIRSDGFDGPVLFLTARGTELDLWEGFTRGADDYVRKPFSVSELMLRMDALMRRGAEKPPRTVLTVGDLTVNTEDVLVDRAGVPIQLSPTEMRLLVALMEHAGKVLSRAQLISMVWGDDEAADPNTVETYIRYLRRKVDEDREPLIHTVRGFGYTIRAPR